jgi:hypothetical protein
LASHTDDPAIQKLQASPFRVFAEAQKETGMVFLNRQRAPEVRDWAEFTLLYDLLQDTIATLPNVNDDNRDEKHSDCGKWNNNVWAIHG